jgi:hypothetical protein
MLNTTLVQFVLLILSVAALFAIWAWNDGSAGWGVFPIALIVAFAPLLILWLLNRFGLLADPLPPGLKTRPGPLTWIAAVVIFALFAAKLLGWG